MIIRIFQLIKPKAVSNESFFALLYRARQIALKIEGVYDLALYQTEQEEVWHCTMNVENDETLRHVQSNSEFRPVWDQLLEMGVQISREDKLRRKV